MNFAHLHLIMNHIPLIGIPVALLSLVYTANLDGKIRHIELRSGGAAQTDGPPATERKGGDDD